MIVLCGWRRVGCSHVRAHWWGRFLGASSSSATKSEHQPSGWGAEIMSQ